MRHAHNRLTRGPSTTLPSLRDGNSAQDDREFDGAYVSVTVSSPNCWLIKRETKGFNSSPVFVNTKARFASDQSSLKLVASAEIHICRTGALGEMTNREPSSKEMCRAPA